MLSRVAEANHNGVLPRSIIRKFSNCQIRYLTYGTYIHIDIRILMFVFFLLSIIDTIVIEDMNIYININECNHFFGCNLSFAIPLY